MQLKRSTHVEFEAKDPLDVAECDGRVLVWSYLIRSGRMASGELQEEVVLAFRPEHLESLEKLCEKLRELIGKPVGVQP